MLHDRHRRHVQYLQMVRDESPPFVRLGDDDDDDDVDGADEDPRKPSTAIALGSLCDRSSDDHQTKQPFADATFGCQHGGCVAGS